MPDKHFSIAKHTEGEPWVFINVPERHAARVLRLLTELLEAEIGTEPTFVNQHHSAEESVELGSQWSDALILRMYRESPRSLKRILNLLAEAPGQELTTEDFARTMGPEANWKNVAGALGAFGRRVKSRYRMGTWPFDHRWDADDDRAYYTMDQRTADLVRAAEG